MAGWRRHERDERMRGFLVVKAKEMREAMTGAEAALAVIQAQCQHNGAIHYTDPLTCALCGSAMPSPPTPPAQ